MAGPLTVYELGAAWSASAPPADPESSAAPHSNASALDSPPPTSAVVSAPARARIGDRSETDRTWTAPMQTQPALLPRTSPPPLTIASEVYPRPRSGLFAKVAPANEVVDVAPPSGVRVAPTRIDASADDVDLVRAASAGDARAHDAIWRKYSVLVRSKMGRSVGGHDVEDLVQEVFLRLFEYLPHLRDPAALRSFLIGITLRVAGTELRRRRCRWWLTLTATGELPEPNMRTDDGSDAREVLSRLLAVRF